MLDKFAMNNNHLLKKSKINRIKFEKNKVKPTKTTPTTPTSQSTDKDIVVKDKIYFKILRDVFNEPRHLEEIKGHDDCINQNWRTKERMKTFGVGIVLCLNVGVDPPDIIKPNPHAVTQCWTDPFASAPTKASDTIVNNLIKQYEKLQSRPRYKHCVDPTIEEVKKICTSLRRTSKEERVLFHYNGHGVPKPTLNGEIWVFNRSFTQYIPLSLYDLQQWMGCPSIYVFDCSNAGTILETFQQFAIQQQKEYEMNLRSMNNSNNKDGENVNKPTPPPNYQNCILLAACGKGEILPLHPDLPADLFTSCLTTPIKTYLVWFLKRNSRKLTPEYTIDFIDKIPGQPNDRKTVLGELHWIFTAVTDTIAWNTLPRELFQRLFRQDPLVASLFRNFLLAQRICRCYDCTPTSKPKIKSTHDHPMWEAWDQAVDHCISQLFKNDGQPNHQAYTPSPFFAQQLTAFQVWLKLDSHLKTTPEKLPIVLQVLLSQVHRSRALDLLGNFLNLGSWAVNLALSVGIFPYVLKLLQASARELRPFLVFIWAKILAIDESSQNELIRDNAHKYFMNVLSDSNISINHQVMSAFVLSVMIRHNPNGQRAVIQNSSNYQSGSIIDIALNLLMDDAYDHMNLRKWLIICLGNVWENNEEVRWLATRNAVYEKLYSSLTDPVPEVRAATVFALGTFINSITQRNEHANEIDRNIVSTLIQKVYYDSSPLVRKELLVTLHWFILTFENNFLPIFRKKAFEEFISSNNNVQAYKFSKDNGSIHVSMLSVNSSLNIPNNHSSGETTLGGFKQNSRIFSKLLAVPENCDANKLNDLSIGQLTPPNHMKSNSFSSMNTSNQSLTSIFDRVLQVLELYKLDPHNEIANQAQIIFNEMHSKAFTIKDNCSDTSEPSSPTNRAKYLSNESPIANSAEFMEKTLPINENKHHSGRVSVSALSSPYLPQSNNHTKFLNQQYFPKRTIFGKDPLQNGKKEIKLTNGMCNVSKESLSSTCNSMTDSYQACRKPLISTTFVDWCTKQFSQPCSHAGICCCTNMELNNNDTITEWRSNMITNYYIKSKNDLMHSFDETKTYKTKILRKTFANCSKFHPFEKYLALADETSFSIWNYSNDIDGDNVETYENDSHSSAKITDLHIINTHGKALLMVASDDSSIKVWRNVFPLTFPEISLEDYDISTSQPNIKSRPQLATAFFMFEDLPLRQQASTGKDKKRFVSEWNETKQRLIAGGDNRFIRLWDANHERKIRDIVVGSEVVTSVNSDSNHLICVGCEDGAVRVFDDRIMQNDGRILSFSGRMVPVVNAKIWHHSYSDPINMVSGHTSGEICWYDKRFTTKAVRVETNEKPMTSMGFHSNTDVFSCAFGSENSVVQFFQLDTIKGPTIKNRNRRVQNISLHDLKAKIAICSSDSTVTICRTPLRSHQVYIL